MAQLPLTRAAPRLFVVVVANVLSMAPARAGSVAAPSTMSASAAVEFRVVLVALVLFLLNRIDRGAPGKSRALIKALEPGGKRRWWAIMAFVAMAMRIVLLHDMPI